MQERTYELEDVEGDMVLDNGGARIPGTKGFIDVGRRAGGKPQPRTDVQEMQQWQHG